MSITANTGRLSTRQTSQALVKVQHKELRFLDALSKRRGPKGMEIERNDVQTFGSVRQRRGLPFPPLSCFLECGRAV